MTRQKYEELETLGLCGCQIHHVFRIFDTPESVEEAMRISEERNAVVERSIEAKERALIAGGSTLPYTPKWQEEESQAP